MLLVYKDESRKDQWQTVDTMVRSFQKAVRKPWELMKPMRWPFLSKNASTTLSFSLSSRTVMLNTQRKTEHFYMAIFVVSVENFFRHFCQWTLVLKSTFCNVCVAWPNSARPIAVVWLFTIPCWKHNHMPLVWTVRPTGTSNIRLPTDPQTVGLLKWNMNFLIRNRLSFPYNFLWCLSYIKCVYCVRKKNTATCISASPSFHSVQT